MTDYWVRPTKYIDLEDGYYFWADKALAYDGSVGTNAYCQALPNGGWTSRLELYLSSPIYCDKIRFNGSQLGAYGYPAETCYVELYYNSAWHIVYNSSTYQDQQWQEVSIGTLEYVWGARIKANNTAGVLVKQFNLYEFNFNDYYHTGEAGYAGGGGGNVWFSRVGDYENFEEGVKDSDSFSLEIPTTNTLQWIESLEALFVGTSGDEWKIGSNNLDTPITPTNYTVKQQSTYGSSYIQTIRANDVILFVDFVGRKVRELTFSDAAAKYVAPDMTALAEHITNSGIVCYAHQKNPDSILWCVLGDGSLISMTYEREQNVVAWSKHPIDGLVQSVCVTPAKTEDEIWLSVFRTIAGEIIYWEDAAVDYEGEIVRAVNYYVSIEKMMLRTPPRKLADNFFVDCGITVENNPASTTISGLNHLVGETVVVLADGAIQASKVVDASGNITLDKAASKVQIGLPFTSLLEPVRMDVQTQGGTTYGSIKKIHKIIVNFLNTAGAQYGKTTDKLHNFYWTNERLINTSNVEGLFAGQIDAVFDGGFETEDKLVITNSAPLPCMIRSIVLRMETTGE